MFGVFSLYNISKPLEEDCSIVDFFSPGSGFVLVPQRLCPDSFCFSRSAASFSFKFCSAGQNHSQSEHKSSRTRASTAFWGAGPKTCSWSAPFSTSQSSYWSNTDRLCRAREDHVGQSLKSCHSWSVEPSPSLHVQLQHGNVQLSGTVTFMRSKYQQQTGSKFIKLDHLLLKLCMKDK